MSGEYLSQGDTFLSTKHFQEALDCYNQAISSNPECFKAHIQKRKPYKDSDNIRKP